MPARRPQPAPAMDLSPKPAPRLYDPGSKRTSRPPLARGPRTMTISYKRDHRPGLYCVELRTANWAESVQWYREALGLRVLVRVVDDGYALFEAGETRLALLARKNSGDASPRWSLGFEIDNLELVAQRLLEAGSPITRPRDDPEGFQEIITQDPDGNTIRLFAWPNA
jgi:catechol 2,3-dioxygenase-like lactoylglutathione lyase family enzyme